MTDVLVYAQPEHVDPASIPIIDFAPFLSGTMSDRHAVADRIAQACRSTGFFFLVNHGVPDSLRQQVLQQAKAFFDRPFDRKMQSAPLLDGQWCGYLPARGAAEGSEPGGSLVPGTTFRKVSGGSLQQFNMMRVLDADDPNYDSDDAIYQRNRWPSDLPEFVETMVVNQQAVRRLGNSLLQAFSLALGLEEDALSVDHSHPLATFGLNFYPAREADAADGQVGVGAHCDASSFTVLLQDDVGGLEVRAPDGRWIAAPPVPGAYVVNIGDTLMALSNGRFVSTLHRVVSRRPLDRYSATMFMNPNRETVVAPLAALVSEDAPARFPPFLNDDYMRGFFVRFYDQMFKAG